MQPGDAVRLEMTKWVDRPHWEMDAVFLGSDVFGDWIGFPVGTHMSRPGMAVDTTNPQVGLVPAAGEDGRRGWVATFHGPGGSVLTYVDMTTPPVWDGATVRCVDLDLDVVQSLDGTVYVDDEDEFEEHQVELDYPLDVIRLASTTSAAVFMAVQAGAPPYDGTAQRWLAALEERVA